MNLPAGPGWVCQHETADGFPNSFFLGEKPFLVLHTEKTPEIGGKKSSR